MNEKEKESLELLIENCPELFRNGGPQVFQYFNCPIAIVEADVKEYIIDEYDSVELLVLRLYKAGLVEKELIAELTGLEESLVEKLLYSEKYVYAHINPHTGEITKEGEKTLEENTDPNHLFQHALYNVKRELQVDALTGTLIRAEMEWPESNMKRNDLTTELNIRPRDSVDIDAELQKEIHDRLQTYIDKGYFEEGSTIQAIGDLKTRDICYRSAYYVRIEGFTYPFLALHYYRFRKGKREKLVAPIAISLSDAQKIGMERNVDRYVGKDNKYLIRDDSFFEYLKKEGNKFTACPDANIYLQNKLVT